MHEVRSCRLMQQFWYTPDPLRWAYVEHIVLGVGTRCASPTPMARSGTRISPSGIESFTANADIRIICQNPIVRVLDGGALNIGVYQDKSGITNNTTINLNTAAEQRLHYRILNLAQITYEVAFKPRNSSDTLA